MNWFVYIVKCSNASLYTGITTDISRRLSEHNTSKNIGSKYVRSRRPVTLVYCQTVNSRREALKKESSIKKLSRLEKLHLILNAENVRN